jgi:ADP-dependent phosphofructokinase/glucokinase
MAPQAGVALTNHSLVALDKAVLRQEARLAEQADPRNTPSFVARYQHRFARAQRMRPRTSRVLFGFTRLIDAKVMLSPALIETAAKDGAVDRARLLALIDSGPAMGTWGSIDDPTTLLAAVLRHQVAGEGKSLQLQITSKLSQWLETVLARGNFKVKRSVGGAAAFGANLVSVFPGTRVTFHSAQTVSPEQARGFTRGVRVVTASTSAKGAPARRVADPEAPTKINYIIESGAGVLLPRIDRTAPGAEALLRVDGRWRAARTADLAGRIILSTQASYDPTFDPKLKRAQLEQLARFNDVFVLVGLHYLTSYEPSELARVARRLERQLRVLRAANPELYVHYQYVRAKNVENEWRAFRAVHGLIDSMSLNATELRALARALQGKRLEPRRRTVRIEALGEQNQEDERQAQEEPSEIYRLGQELMLALGLRRLHVHGYDVDLILQRNGNARSMRRQSMAAMKGRQVGVNKVVGASGEIRRSADLWPVTPSVSGQGLGALQRFGDFLAREEGLNPAARQRVVESGIYLDGADGVSVAISPSRRFNTIRGGLVSLGDTLDLTTLVYGR